MDRRSLKTSLLPIVLTSALPAVVGCGSGPASLDSTSSDWRFKHHDAGVDASPPPDAGSDSSSSPDSGTSGDSGADAGTPSGIVPADCTIDWSHAGVVRPDGTRGIPNRTTVCATINAATYGNGTTDVSGALQSAINACPPGQVVYLPAGTYLLTNSVLVQSSVVLRGAGPATKIIENNANIQFNGAGSSWIPSQTFQANWTAGYAKGTTVITLDDTSNLHVGQVMVLDQLNDSNVTTPGYVPLVNPTGNEGTVGVGVNDGASRDGLSFETDGAHPVPRALMQFAEVTSINGNQVTLDRPIYITHLASLSPQAFFWAGGNLSYAGVESLRIDAQFGSQAVAFTFCTNCWAKGIEVDHIGRGAVSLWYDDHFEFRDSYLYMNGATAPENYGVEVDDTGASLFENNVLDNITSGILVSMSSNGNVIAYNWAVNPSPGSAALFASAGTHCVHTSMNLWEGNSISAFSFDYIWGSTSHQTLFRNRVTGYLPPVPYGGVLWSNGNWPLWIESWNRFFTIAGNVLGTEGVPNGYQAADVASGSLVGASQNTSTCPSPTCGMGVGPIYVLGYWDSWQADSTTNPYDPLVAATMFRWGNFDYFTNTTHWDPAEVPAGEQVPTTQTLPASLYMSGKPSWFGGAPWPAIGPDVAGLANKLPAQLCYEKLGLGSGGTFDPTQCY